MSKFVLAIDIGASSGRHIVGEFVNGEIILHEVFRFPNKVININKQTIWDIDYLLKNVIEGIKEALKQYKDITSLAIDTWGVDYLLMNKDNPIYPMHAYRSQRTLDIIDEVHDLISFKDLYKITGSQFQPFNSVYQFYKDKKEGRLDKASDYLMVPEFLSYCLTGKKIHEYTNASTTGMLDLNNKQYSEVIINKLGLKPSLFKSKFVFPGEDIGYLREEISNYVGKKIMVKASPSHDTASAVEAIKMDINSPYISSGTWSLLGIKLDKGINNSAAMKANFTNEYGPSYIRFQKNIMGLWIIQNLSKELNLSFIEMVELAKDSSFKQIYDVNDNVFLSSTNMRETIINYFVNHNLKAPSSNKDIISSTYHSLAYSYKIALEELESLTNQKYEYLYIVGGGAKNKYLNDLTAAYTGKKVIALPIEATALGNIISQLGGTYGKRN